MEKRVGGSTTAGQKGARAGVKLRVWNGLAGLEQLALTAQKIYETLVILFVDGWVDDSRRSKC